MTDAFLRFRCSCGAKLKAPIEKIGQTVGCPTCLARVTVPEPAPVQPGAEVDLAEVDDEPEPQPEPKRSRKTEREVDDGIPIRRGDRGRERYRDDYDDEDDIPIRRATDYRSVRRAMDGRDGQAVTVMVISGIGFLVGCLGSAMSWAKWHSMEEGDRLRYAWGLGDKEEKSAFALFSLLTSLGFISMFVAGVLAAAGWAYHGASPRARMFRVATILGWAALFFYSGVYAAFSRH